MEKPAERKCLNFILIWHKTGTKDGRKKIDKKSFLQYTVFYISTCIDQSFCDLSTVSVNILYKYLLI